MRPFLVFFFFSFFTLAGEPFVEPSAVAPSVEPFIEPYFPLFPFTTGVLLPPIVLQVDAGHEEPRLPEPSSNH